MKIKVMGKEFGKAIGWDQVSDFIIGFYSPKFKQNAIEKNSELGLIDYIEFDLYEGTVKGYLSENENCELKFTMTFDLFASLFEGE